jgi:hypothetical protein
MCRASFSPSSSDRSCSLRWCDSSLDILIDLLNFPLERLQINGQDIFEIFLFLFFVMTPVVLFMLFVFTCCDELAV